MATNPLKNKIKRLFAATVVLLSASVFAFAQPNRTPTDGKTDQIQTESSIDDSGNLSIQNSADNSILNEDANTQANGIVYICPGPEAKRYHKSQNCRGLSNCTHHIVAVSIGEAISKDRTPCKICCH